MGSTFSSAQLAPRHNRRPPASKYLTDQINMTAALDLRPTPLAHRLRSQTCRTAHITISPTLGSCTSWLDFAAAIFQRAASSTYATHSCRQTPEPKADLKRYSNKEFRTSANTQLDLDRLRSQCCAPARACPIVSLAESNILYRVSDVSST